MRTGALICGIPLAASMALAQAAGSNSEKPLTFSGDVAPILYKHCVTCHHPGDIAPMSLLTYKDARPWAAAIREVDRSVGRHRLHAAHLFARADAETHGG